MLLEAEAHDPELGFVGSVTKVNPELITRTLAMDLIPVIATIGADETGQTYNINADDAATEIAQELARGEADLPDRRARAARRRRRPRVAHHPGRPPTQVQELINSGVISGGMIPKMAGCIRAIERGVGSVHLIDGRLSHVLLLELLTRAGVGTMVVAADDAGPTS